ncbi:MAG: hypothetical protein IJF78_04700 [Clostridia bacterium]|nr:hypothetical protein [Clostridia bacterium]
MIQKALSAPAWLTSGGIYQINPRTFSAEGTVSAVTKELPFLADLGFGTIYLCPIFEEDDSENRDNWSKRQKASETQNPKNPYRMNDYFRIDEEYGTMEDLAECIRECHRLGMHLILDLVYLHIGPNAAILKIHPEFAKQNMDGSFINGYWNFPLLDFNHPGLREYLWSNMVYYIVVLDADGFRCDVGDGVPLDFWTEGCRRIRAVKPDAALINEGTRGESLLAAFHAVYGFSWHECIYGVLSGQKDASALVENWNGTNHNYPEGALILRDMDNHDTVTDWPKRAECLAGHRGMDLIQVLNYSIDGIPMVYCGNELCDTTEVSMFANRFHPGRFSPTPREELKDTDQSLRRQEILRTLNHARAEDAVLQTGKTIWLDQDQPDSVLSFMRSSGTRSLWFLGNLSGKEITVRTKTAVPTEDIETILAYGTERNGSSCFTMQPYGFIMIREPLH